MNSTLQYKLYTLTLGHRGEEKRHTNARGKKLRKESSSQLVIRRRPSVVVKRAAEVGKAEETWEDRDRGDGRAECDTVREHVLTTVNETSLDSTPGEGGSITNNVRNRRFLVSGRRERPFQAKGKTVRSYQGQMHRLSNGQRACINVSTS